MARAKRTKGTRFEASPEARRFGCAILEVLSGLRSPTEASEALGITPQRYYKLEERAVRGLLKALETPPRKGRQQSPESELTKARAERDRLQRELGRALALVRVARRAVGFPTKPEGKGSKGKATRGKRKRRPRVRARKLVEELKTPPPKQEPSGSGPGASQTQRAAS